MAIPKILVIAGSDSFGGAGIQADVKAVTLLGGYAATALTAVTAQNTTGVHGVYTLPERCIQEQIQVVLDDIDIDVIKLGMLYDTSVIRSVAGILDSYPDIPVITDPVMVSTSGDVLLKKDAVIALKELILPRSLLVTPNIPEILMLLNFGHKDFSQPENEKKEMMRMFYECVQCSAVLLKGGHGAGETCMAEDLLFDGSVYHMYQSRYIDTKHTHGTGCTLASAIATFLARGCILQEAVAYAKKFVYDGIMHAPSIGKGCGPMGWPEGYIFTPDSKPM